MHDADLPATVVYITVMINKAHSDDNIHQFLESSSSIAVYLEMERCPAKMWVRFASLALAVQSQAFFHQ